MNLAYVIGSSVSVCLWTPILLRFMRSWKARRNPVSLAIVIAILLIIWMSIGGIWIITNQIEIRIFLLATIAMSTIAAVYAHIAFYWSKTRFVNDRKSK